MWAIANVGYCLFGLEKSNEHTWQLILFYMLHIIIESEFISVQTPPSVTNSQDISPRLCALRVFFLGPVKRL